MEELKVKGIDELCEWLEGQPEMKGKYDILEPACKVIREQKIYGDAFITYTWEKWKAEGLPGGVAETLVQIAERVKKESGDEDRFVTLERLLVDFGERKTKKQKTSLWDWRTISDSLAHSEVIHVTQEPLDISGTFKNVQQWIFWLVLLET